MSFDRVNAVFASEYTSGDDLKGVLARNLRRARVARRLSLSELARGTNLGKATLSQIEAGNANPTVETLRLLADALGLRVADLLDDPDGSDVRVVRAARRVDASQPLRRPLDRFAAAGAIDVVELRLPAGHAEELPPGPPGAREELLVVGGSVVAGPVERPTELSAGDWASFPADVARQLTVGRTALRALLLTHA